MMGARSLDAEVTKPRLGDQVGAPAERPGTNMSFHLRMVKLSSWWLFVTCWARLCVHEIRNKTEVAHGFRQVERT